MEEEFIDKDDDMKNELIDKEVDGQEELEELEHRYFMLEMQDIWDSSDYKYADELRRKIRSLKEKQNND